jgi:hypothetical protein
VNERLFDPDTDRPGLARSDGSDTMLAAAASQLHCSGAKRLAVLRAIVRAGERGATDAELESIVGLRHQTASARRNELARDGWIEDSGARRLTDSGRHAIVWVLTPAGQDQFPSLMERLA